MPGGLPGSWRECQPSETSEKVMEVGMAAERFALWVLFHLIGLLALWIIEEGKCEAVLGLDGVT